MKRTLVCLLFIVTLITRAQHIYAQTEPPVPRVAVFAPLFLDSCFDAKGVYKYGKMVPKFAIPGVEYYFGATLAIDSLKKEGQKLHISYIDSRSQKKPVSTLVQNGELDNFDMLIGSVSGNDIKLLADFAKQKNIPFISGTFPNDAGVTNNPNTVILNSTLKTHCESIYQYLQKNQPSRKTVVLTKPGRQEDRIKGYFSEFEKNTSGEMLALTYTSLGTGFTGDSILNFIDTTVLATYIVGSTDAALAIEVARGLAEAGQQENSILVGMPTWDDIKEFSKPEYKELNIFYPTPMTIPVNKPALAAAAKFKTKFGSIAGDNMYRGYENIYHFCKLLLKYGKNTPANYTDKNFMLYSSYSLQPVMLSNTSMTLDYFENKKIWIINKYNGLSKTISLP
ncbi:MAG: ABC transporter substrate-binding protein [Dinghuibacter sp.]|nr:ABC transporter substrate-binding protein [Dinghuibacter sp.]